MAKKEVDVKEIARDETTIREFLVEYNGNQKERLPFKEHGIPRLYEYHPSEELMVLKTNAEFLTPDKYRVIVEYGVPMLPPKVCRWILELYEENREKSEHNQDKPEATQVATGEPR